MDFHSYWVRDLNIICARKDFYPLIIQSLLCRIAGVWIYLKEFLNEDFSFVGDWLPLWCAEADVAQLDLLKDLFIISSLKGR